MAIQWYPGHMHKARREMAQALGGVDVLIEVRDARLPYSSANPVLGELGGHLPRLVVLTRRDLADPDATSAWLEALPRERTATAVVAASTAAPTAAMSLDLTDDTAARRIPAELTGLAGPAPANREGPRTAMIVGIPNVGKSTLVNRLAGRAIAATGNEPAVTRRQQTVRLAGDAGDRWRLSDTPGVLWPNLENPLSGYRLAASGAVRDTAMDSADVALALVGFVEARYPGTLRGRYGPTVPEGGADLAPGIASPDDAAAGDGGAADAFALAALEAIGRARGCLGGGGLVDFDRAARLLLADFRAGRLGRLTLETPAMAARERAATLVRSGEREAAREAKREARRTRRKRAAGKAAAARAGGPDGPGGTGDS